MKLFRSKKSEAAATDAPDAANISGGGDEPTTETTESSTAGVTPAALADVPTDGPYDAADADKSVDRLDLGSLQIPPLADVEIRLEVEESSGRVAAMTLTDGTSMCQVVAFAASRTTPLWKSIRSEIASSLLDAGGQADDVDGEFGTELFAQPQGGDAMRIVGVDGPRWLLRGVFNGPAAAGGEAAASLEEAFRAIVVVRGDAAMPPRDQLPLRLPQGVGGPVAPPEETMERPVLTVPRRGPEITEIR